MTTGNMSRLIQCQQVNIDKLGMWMAQRVSNEKKKAMIIMLHRTLKGTNQGMQTSMSQCNQMR